MPESTRELRLGICGPVGTGKSSLIMLVCARLGQELEIGVVTNDIYTDEDARMIRAAGVLDPERIVAVETGACPHTAIRDDITANLLAVEDLVAALGPLDVVLVESGGDNLTATFSPALVDAQVFVLDVAGGGDVVRKGGPGISRADLLVVNKTDPASVAELRAWVLTMLGAHRSGHHVPVDPGPMAPHSHGEDGTHSHGGGAGAHAY